jgi:putative phosphoesterase
MRLTRIIPDGIKLPCRIGVISDSHIDNRTKPLNPRVFQIFRESQVDLIFHLGDITNPRIINELEQIAPVYMVRGNRDFFIWPNIPSAILMEIGGLSIGLMHGHGTTLRYLWDKMHFVFVGFRFERYRGLLDQMFPAARIKLFGHTHVTFSRMINGILYFNPGAASEVSMHDPHPSVGILHLDSPDQYRAEIVYL